MYIVFELSIKKFCLPHSSDNNTEADNQGRNQVIGFL